MSARALVGCVACGRWRPAEAVQLTLAGPVCAWCLDAQIDWDASEPPGVETAGAPIPLDRIKRRAGDVELPGLEGA